MQNRISEFQTVPSKEAGVVSTTNSPFCRLRPVPIRAVQMHEGFWKPRIDKNATIGLRRQMEQLREHGVVDNFLRLYGKSAKEFQGYSFCEEHLYKLIEAASWTLQTYKTPEIERMIDETIKIIEPAQGEDGYLNTYYQRERAAQRWTDGVSPPFPEEKMGDYMYELYCAGHLFQTAVAHHRSTGDEKLLRIACRYADYICEEFGPGRRQGHPGHPEIEMALIELYRETGVRRYLDTAGFFIDQLGGKEMHEILGHAVRAVYFCCGMADYYAETGGSAYLKALERLWKSMTETKMYITGAVGGRVRAESFGREFELPNENSYTETCAAIGSAFWNWRMLSLNGEARFADLLELTMYNSILSGVSLSGDRYFYMNPHASNGRPTGDPWYTSERHGVSARQEWFPVFCCPPNVARFLASVSGYFYSTSEESIWVHLYDNSTVRWHLQDGTEFSLSQKTNYPWDGRVEIQISSEEKKEVTLHIRIPGWCRDASITVDEISCPSPVEPGTYYEIKRSWKGGAKIVLSLAMPPTLIISNPMAAENRCSVAVKRGPLIYCFEGVDNPELSVREAKLTFDPEDPPRNIRSQHRQDLLGGVTVLTGEASVPVENWGFLYKPFDKKPLEKKPVTLKAIPYYAWANRGPSEMTVWLQMDKTNA
jgi:DUF1680 family protein